MTAFSLAYTLHVLAALIWVGGMFFAWMILRPAAVTALEGPARLKLWVEVFQRFFVWVWIAVAVLVISGMGMLHLRFAGFETAPRYVQVMIGGAIAMLALFIRLQTLLLPALRKAVQAAGIDYDSAEVQFVASFDQEVDSVEDAQKLFRIVDALEDLDDVQTVFTNADLTPEVEAALDSED